MVPMDMRFADTLSDEDIERGIAAARELAELTAAEPEGPDYEIPDVRENTTVWAIERRITFNQGKAEFAEKNIEFTDLTWLDWGINRTAALGEGSPKTDVQMLTLAGAAGWALDQFIADKAAGEPYFGMVKIKVIPHLLKVWITYSDCEPQIAPLAPEFTEWLACIKRPGGNGDWIKGRDDEDVEYAIQSIEVISLTPAELAEWETRYRAQAWPKVHLE